MGSPEEARVRLPQLRLDELLEQLQARLDAARGTRDRVHSLLEAVLSVGRDLNLEQALYSIVEAAATLVDAEYAALGVIGPDGKRLSAFYTIGVTHSADRPDRPLPGGARHPRRTDREPRALRLVKISEHPSSYGFPPHHPPMNTFLGVPMRRADQIFGNLYLTEKRGGLQFDEEDESVLATLAVAAGVAIDNARLYEDSRLRERWLGANAEITDSLMSGRPHTEVLGLIAERAIEITGSALAAVALPMEDTGSLAVEIAVGMDAEAHRGLVLPLDRSLMGLAFSGAAPVTSGDVGHDDRISLEPPRFGGLGPAVAVPIGTGEAGARGVVLLAREAGRQAFSATETETLQAFAAQAAVAMELAERRQDAEEVAVLKDRDRIARDLPRPRDPAAVRHRYDPAERGPLHRAPGGLRTRGAGGGRPGRDRQDHQVRRSSACARAGAPGRPGCGPAPYGWPGRRHRFWASLPACGWRACWTPTCRRRSPTTWWRCSPRRWPTSPGTPVPTGPRWSWPRTDGRYGCRSPTTAWASRPTAAAAG
ncbi:hypothetical protein SALBM311S_10050 [Streptomyces alboniger]